MKIASLLIAVFALAGCSPATDSPATEGPAAADTAANPPRSEALVVYAGLPGEAALKPVFEAFTANSGIPVSVRESTARQNLDDVIQNRGAPPADVLLTDTIADIWLAGDEGALRKLPPASGIDDIEAAFRDPDKLWVAATVDPIMIVQPAGADTGPTLEMLAGPGFERELCLGRSNRAGNTALIAYLIDELGRRDAEIRVRRWLANLALPPHASAGGLLEDVDGGICAAAVATLREIGLSGVDAAALTLTETGYASGFGVGIARHARYPDNAARLIAWLLGPDGQAAMADATATRALPRTSADEVKALNVIGWQREEARLLAERARWQP